MRDPTDVRGFTLIETLVACALLATALLSVGHLSTAAVTLLMESRSRTEATLLAITKLEELRSSQAPLAGSDTVDSRGQRPAGSVSRLFDRRWAVTAVAADARILTVTVTPHGAARDVAVAGGWAPPP
jgi:prepilin-type N-terminal cleavage/methylation domain-containing protein